MVRQYLHRGKHRQTPTLFDRIELAFRIIFQPVGFA